MKFALSLGVAFAAITLAAAAHTNHTRVVVRHGGGPAEHLSIDANEDGWVTRAEASAAADRVFADLDSNNDGRLSDTDHAALAAFDIDIDAPEFDVLEGGDGEVRIIRRGDGHEVHIEREVERAVRHAERQAEHAQRQAEHAEPMAERAVEHAERRLEQAERRAEEAERRAERIERDVDRRVERHITVIRSDGDDVIAPMPPMPPLPPRMPMFMMLIANSEEADTNNDGSLSREEFRAQHLRFFDASDANGDGRVRFDPPEPPEPPEAPEPPEPPEPPRRR